MVEEDGGEEYGEEEMGEEGEQEIEAPPQVNENGGCSIKLDFGLDDIFQQALNNPPSEPPQDQNTQGQQNLENDLKAQLSTIQEEANEESSKLVQPKEIVQENQGEKMEDDEPFGNSESKIKQDTVQTIPPQNIKIKIEGLDLEFNEQSYQNVNIKSQPNQLSDKINNQNSDQQIEGDLSEQQQNQMNFNQFVEPPQQNNNVISFDNMDFMDLDQPMEEQKQQPQNLVDHPNQQSTNPLTFEIGQLEQPQFPQPPDAQQNFQNESLNIKLDSGLDNQIEQPNNSIKIDFETGLADQEEFNMKVSMPQDEQLKTDSVKKPELAEVVQNDMEVQQPVPEVKKSSKKSNRENRLITDIYNLKKVKYTLDFGSQISSKVLRTGQFIYTLEMKEKEEILSLIEKWKKEEVTKINFKLALHLKQFQIQEIWVLKQGDNGGRFQKHGESLKMPKESKLYGEDSKSKKSNTWYVSPQMQAKAFENSASEHMREKYGKKDITPKIPIELNLFDHIQKDTCYWGEGEAKNWLKDHEDKSSFESYRKKPELCMTIFDQKLKDQTAEELYVQILEKNGPKFKFLVTIGKTKEGLGQQESITNFGIKAVDYMLEEQKYSNISSKKDRLATYMVTSDSYEASQSWIPQIFGTTRQPINWTMNYLIPSNCSVISSGKFLKKVEYPSHSLTMYIFKSKSQKVENQEEDEFQIPNSKLDTKGKIIPDNIGFVIGILPFQSMVVKEKPDQSIFHLGTALFTSPQKLSLFEDRGFYSSQIQAIISEIGKMLRFEHPCNSEGDDNQKLLKLVFVPNLFRRKSLKQSMDFADGIHIFDEEVLLPRNVIEKRHKIYKILGTSLAFDWFGAMIWEKSIEDTWLLCGMRERIGDRYRRKKTGISMYKYQIMKTMRKYTEAIEKNSERFSLSSKFLPHFTELTYGEDLWFQKCQLVMHIVEQILQETHYINVSRVLLKNANPTMSVSMFKDQLKNCGIKDDNIKKNWIESTSCVQIECSYEFIKKSNSVKINLVQKSLVKNHMLLCDHLKFNEQSKHLINPRGDQILEKIENFEDLSKRESLNEEERKKEREDRVKQDLETNYYFDKKRQAKRWFLGDINVAIYQTDGAEIQCQTQKIKLKHAKSNVEQSINLNCKVRKAHGRKKDEGFDEIDDGYNDGQQRSSMPMDPNIDIFDNNMMNLKQRGTAQDPVKAKAEQYLQQYKDNSQWKFGFLFDYEFKEYPERGTKSLFQRKNTDSPILWIRIDPDCEYIRRVKIVNSNQEAQKESWLFQLLQDRDDISQFEACYELRNFNDEFVFEILKSVAQNEKYFIKVRKQALKSLEFIQESAFKEVLTYEQLFLVKFYNFRNYNEKIGFYKSNDFKNILEYYFNTYLLRSLAKSKENKLKLRDDIIKFKNEQASKMKENHMFVESKFGQGTVKYGVQDDEDDNEMSENQDSQNAEDEQKKREQFIDVRDFSITTQTISDLILRVLRENENSENAFDDSFFIGKILSNLGKLDNFQVMPDIAQEVLKHLNLDLTGKFSPQYAISKGAIKSSFNLRKQIWKFRNIKKQYLVDINKSPEDQYDDNEEIKHFEQGILQTEKILNQLDQQFESILRDPCWPYELRTFIFQKKVKNMFLYQQDVIEPVGIPQSVLMPLQILLGQILKNVNDFQYQFAATQLEMIAKFLEKNFVKKLNFKEALIDSEICSKVSKYLSHLILSHPICLIDRQIVVWAKRIFNTVFMGSGIPLFLKSRIDYQNYPETQEKDDIWFQIENFQQQKDAPNFKQVQPQSNMQNVTNFPTGIDQIASQNNSLQAPFSNIISIDPQLGSQNQYANNSLLNFAIPNQVPILGSQQQSNFQIQTMLADNAAKAAQGIQILSPHKDLQSNQITIDILGAQANQAHQNPNPSSSQPILSFQSQDQIMSDPNALANQQAQGTSLQINFDELMQSKMDDQQMPPPKPDKKSKKKSKAKNQEELMNFTGNLQNQGIQQDQIQMNPVFDNEDEYRVSVVDDFPDYKFQEPWRQKCWNVLYKCYFHSEAEPFLEPLDSEEYLVGQYGQDFYDQYYETIDFPMTLPMIKTKCIAKMYAFPGEFEEDVLLVFKNAMSFNKRGTGVYKAAANMKRYFQRLNNSM